MNGRIIFSVLAVLALIGLLVGIGAYAYNVGVTQGLAQTERVAPAPGTAPYPYYGPFFYRPFGFGLFGCLIPLFFILLFFGLLRGIFWRGGWGWRGHYGQWQQGVPPRFEEWHRRAHETKPESGPPQQ